MKPAAGEMKYLLTSQCVCCECSVLATAGPEGPLSPWVFMVWLWTWRWLSEEEIIWPVCLQELSGFPSLCSTGAGWECAHRERGNVFDIRSVHTVGEAGTAGYD